MMTSAFEAISDVLVGSGVRRAYTVPGESFLGLLDALDSETELRLVSARHESGAGFMAAGEASMTALPGVALASRGPGAANLSISVHAAMQDSTPMVVLLGQVPTAVSGREAFQEVDLAAFYSPIAKWVAVASSPDAAPRLVAKGLQLAQEGRPGPVAVVLPSDVGEGETMTPTPFVPGSSPVHPDPAALERISRLLAEATRPVIIAGGGARRATAELVRFAELYDVGVYASWRRQDVFPNDHPLYLGHLGIGTPEPVLAALEAADLVLVIGSRLSEPTTQGYSLPGARSRVFQVDVDPAVIGSSVAVELGVVADASVALSGLAGLAARLSSSRATGRDWSGAHEAWLRSTELDELGGGEGVHPARVVAELATAVPPGAVIANDAGNFAAFLHRAWSYDTPLSQVASTSGAMGYGVPAAIGAKLSDPGRVVVSLVGDGGLMMTGQELETAVREEAPVVVIAFHNRLYGTIAQHQARVYGRLAATGIGQIDLASWARSLGAWSASVSASDQLGDAISDALRSGAPALVAVATDPEAIGPNQSLARLMEQGSARRSADPQGRPRTARGEA